MKTLPITQYRDKIVAAVAASQVVIIQAETGAGKSTQVPQYLLEEGYELVITQPRRLAARTVAARVAEELGEDLGKTVGFRTARDRNDSELTRALFCTDGLALVRELVGQSKGILVLDEVHEWNENVEVLVAWAKKEVQTNPDFKLVLMSATLEAQELSTFFDGAPVISVPGRLFPIEDVDPGMSIEQDVASLVAQGRNVLVFQPGKPEIQATISMLKNMDVNAEIIPLHGQLTPAEQAKAFKNYRRPKVVVSTNVAQTSVTIDDIDAVIDSGMERRIGLRNGVEGLDLGAISLADSQQRRGRAGRTKEGVYVDHCPKAEEDRMKFPVAEILRRRLDQTVLRLAVAGFDMVDLEFFHQPPMSAISAAKKTLVKLGCMNDDGEVTRMGKLVNRLPLSVQYARMLIEADRLGVVEDVLTVAAIMEQDGITVPPPSRNRPERPDWRRMVPGEHESDIMGQLAVWRLAKDMKKDEMHEKGIAIRDYYRAVELRKQLHKVVKGYFEVTSSGDRTSILKAFCAGMVENLYRGSFRSYQGAGMDVRELGSASVVRNGEWVVGKPFDLQIKARFGGTRTLALLEMVSQVQPEWLAEIAPQLVEVKTGMFPPRYSVEQDQVVSQRETWFDGRNISVEYVADPDHPEAASLLKEGRAEAAWQSWLAYGTKPLIGLIGNDDPSVPEVVQVVYGQDEDGSNMVAFGTIIVTPSWGSEVSISEIWSRSESEAEQSRESSVIRLESIKQELQRKRETAQAIERAEALLETGRSFVAGLDLEVAQDCAYMVTYRIQNTFWGRTLESVQGWIQEFQEALDAATNNVQDHEYEMVKAVADTPSGPAEEPAQEADEEIDFSDLLARFGPRHD